MKKNKILIGIFGAAALAVIGFFLTRNGSAADSGDLLSANLSAISGDEAPNFELNGNDSLLHFDARTADLGQVKMGEKKEVVFRFTNTATEPVVITQVMTTCECTAANWDKAPLMPGKESQINVIYEAKEEGVFFKKLFIYYAGGATPFEIAIKGEVK